VSQFDHATAVRARHDGHFDVRLDEQWTIGSERPNGGYLLALLARAALAGAGATGAGQRHVVAANVVYVTSPTVGPAVAEVEVRRVGRTATQVNARLVQAGAVTAEALFTLGHLHEGSDPWWGAVAPVDLSPEEACVALPPPPGATDGPSLREVARLRFEPQGIGFLDGEPSGQGELRAWFRFADGRDPDPLSLLFVVDALPPATFDVAATGWVPTLDLTVYVRAVPAPGPLRVQFRAGTISDGLGDETCLVWDCTGRLVAQSTQLVALRLPSP
jgi:hypothetical protein